MTIQTYSDLLTAIINFAWRDGDGEFQDRAADFVSLAEGRLNRELALRVMETDKEASCVAGQKYISLAPDFVEPIALHLTTFGAATPLKMSVAGDMPFFPWEGVPQAWCINDANIQLDRKCDQNHTFVFRYRKAFKLSYDSQTNWLLAHHPDVYIAAALVWGGAFQASSDDMTRWKALLEEALDEIGWKESRSKTGTLSVDPALIISG